MSTSSPKTVPTNASVDDFIAAQPDESRRADCWRLVGLMRAATGEQPCLWGASLVGFGTYRYHYASGRSGDWPVVAFSPRKNDLTVYIMPGFDRYPDLLNRLGRHKTGKSCLYLKRLADVELSVLQELRRVNLEHASELDKTRNEVQRIERESQEKIDKLSDRIKELNHRLMSGAR